MVELTSYGLTGLVAILLVAFCLACKDESASFGEKPSFRPTYDAGLGHPKLVDRWTGAANSDTGQQSQKHEGNLNG